MSAPVTSSQPNIPGKLLRPLPRKRVERFVWQWPDTVWIFATALCCLIVAPRGFPLERSLTGGALDIACVAAAYAAGLKMHGRIAAVTAAWLIATNEGFALACSAYPSTGGVASAMIVAIAGYGIGWLFVSYAAACVAFGFDGVLIGAAIALVPALQKREHAIAGLIGFVAFGVLWSVAINPFHPPAGIRPWRDWDDARPFLGLSILILWFAASFYAEASLKGAMQRWLLSAVLVVAQSVSIFMSVSAIGPQIYVLFPVAMLVIGIGLGRLMPAIAGEYAAPAKRYLAAAAGVLLTVGLELYLAPRPIAAVAPGGVRTAPISALAAHPTAH